MRVAYLTSHDGLKDRVLNLINSRHLVCIRDFPDDIEAFAKLAHEIGEPIAAQHDDLHPHVDRMVNTDDGFWMNESRAWPFHMDGLLQYVSKRRESLPITLLYGRSIEGVQGGDTFFYDLCELYERIPSENRAFMEQQQAAYQHPTLPGASLYRDVPFVHRDRYMNMKYPVWDEWFFRFLERQPSGEQWEFSVDGFNSSLLHVHKWTPRDLLIWTNEGFIHGRSRIEENRREMWRSIVYDRERPRLRYLPKWSDE